MAGAMSVPNVNSTVPLISVAPHVQSWIVDVPSTHTLLSGDILYAIVVLCGINPDSSVKATITIRNSLVTVFMSALVEQMTLHFRSCILISSKGKNRSETDVSQEDVPLHLCNPKSRIYVREATTSAPGALKGHQNFTISSLNCFWSRDHVCVSLQPRWIPGRI